MECNKEEAIRAKELAERRMQNGDFLGAQRIGMRAQRLYPDLDNITQLLTVCDVHCSAEKKLYGSEMDWYGILQIERFSDESVIKKQFRKLALSLHPDKNKFAGAEAAFKLIGEANRVLTDPGKRSLYDLKLGGASRPTKSKPDQSNQNTFIKKQHPVADKIYNAPQYVGPQSYQQPQQPIFWTRCPACDIWYQYQREYRKKVLKCQSCCQPFLAHDLGTPPGSSCSQFVNEKRVPSQGCSQFVASKNAGMPSGTSFTKVPMAKAGKAADTAGTFQSKEVKMETASGIGKDSKPQEKVNGHVDAEAGKRDGSVSMPDVIKTKGSGNAEGVSNKRWRKPVEKSSESFDKGISEGKQNGGNLSAQKSQSSGGHQSKRPLRKKPHITYDENLSDDDDDFVVPLKRSKGDDSPIVTAEEMKEASANDRSSKRDPSPGFTPVVLNGDNKEMKQKARSSQDDRPSNKKSKTRDNKAKVEEAVMSEKAGTGMVKNDEKSEIGANQSNSNEAPTSDIYVYPDPDFSNFERERAESSFAVNQIWAIYDTLDSMPRFYARIKKVIKPGFKLQITWLETSSNNKAERKWSDSGLPVACGRYVNGDTEVSEDNLMFSHKMCCVNAGLNGCYFIYPKKGETWALFKNWDLDWSAEPDKHVPPFDFDYVEVLTDFIEEVGIGVAYLGKVEGFISIFQRDAHNEVLSFTVRPNELYKFSHQIPSFKLTGKEGEGVPVGSYELDTAALPTNFGKLVDINEISAPKNLESGAKTETRSPEKSTGPSKDSNGADADQRRKEEDGDKVASCGKPTQPEGTSACQANEKFPIRKKLEKNKFIADTFTPRRSPRDLSKGRSQINASRCTAEDINEHVAPSKDNSQTQPFSFSCQPEEEMHLHVKDGSLGNSPKGRKSSGARVIEVEPHDFKKERSEDKFQVDQIWALHSDQDGLPKNYCQVKKIDGSSGFRLHVAMLESIRKHTMQHASCGIFKVADGEPIVLPLTAFSHQVKARAIGRDAFEIWPKKGEIWAIKRNADSDKDGGGECDIVEVVEDNSRSVKVVVLKQHKEKIFMFPKGPTCDSMDIRRSDFGNRFSHQCLAFHMGDVNRRLKGFWQLDPNSIPGSVILVE